MLVRKFNESPSHFRPFALFAQAQAIDEQLQVKE